MFDSPVEILLLLVACFPAVVGTVVEAAITIESAIFVT